MKPHLDIKHEGTLGDERTRMTFDENSVAHLMSILTDLYSDPALAVIREYSTNGLDSHISAGQTRPIEVELPTGLRPMFVVRDFGVGMTVDQIINNFSKYGWSSKRDSNDAVGMLGLGCKSGLSYTSQFTMVSVHDGVQVTVLVTREEDGAGAVQIIDTVTTEKPNGVEVQIPVSRPSEFEHKAKRFFRFWEPGTVLVNGEPPMTYQTLIQLADDIEIVGHVELDHDVIVMGNVPYPVPNITENGLVMKGRLIYESPSHTGERFAVVRVPIGAVDFTPSREALHMTKRTQDAIAVIQERTKKLVTELAQAAIDAAPNAGAGAIEALKWRGLVPPTVALAYRGLEVPNYVPLRLPVVVPYREGEPVRVLSIEVSPNKGYNQYSEKSTQITSIGIEGGLKCLHVVGFKGNGVLETTKKKVTKYVQDNGLFTDTAFYARFTVLFYGPEFGSPWLDHVMKVQFADIQAIDLGESKETKKRSKWRLLNHNGYFNDTDTLPSSERTVWFCPDNGFNKKLLGERLRRLGLHGVGLQNRQVNAFVKANPEILHVTEWARQAIANCTPTASDMLASRRNAYSGTWFERVPVRAVADADLAAVLTECRGGNSTRREKFNGLVDLCSIVGVAQPTIDTSTLEARIERAKRRYPILKINVGYDSQFTRGHVVEIINSLYATRKHNPRYQ